MARDGDGHMPFLSNLPPDAGVRHILQLNKPAGRALVSYHEAVMRQASELSVGERELIAAYVSGLNACRYCHGVHAVTARSFGIPEDLLASLLSDPENADTAGRLAPILRYARRLTEEPAKTTEADVEAILAAGWTEQAIHDAVAVICLFNFMNRLLEGHGVKGNDEIFRDRGRSLMSGGYAPLLDFLK